ncbi:unnamed protein product [Fraxinus pennsylvanica]|uniref:NAC domain-containing protein n=1 Tax=Fraxinus pennsylvanica TaxID=56036 RepID=A0AAD2ED56_9LAMI|nr:unnamed protein product [Fraxinus pennsylvanica]
MGDKNVNLPPGFRFYPTDEELVVHFLHRKAALLPCHPDVIPDLDLYPYDPWDLEGKAMKEGNKWYFYSRRTQNRITGSGYWQAIGIDEPIYSSSSNQKEYRISDSSSTSRSSRRRNSRTDYSKWVVCRVYERDGDDDDNDGPQLSCLDEVYLSLEDLDEISLPN